MIIDEPEESVSGIPEADQAAINSQRYKALIITGIVLPLMLYPYLGHLFLIYTDNYTFRIIGSEILKWCTLGLLYLYAYKAEGNKFLLWREKRYDPWFYMVSIFIVYILVMCCGAIAGIPHRLGYHDNNSLMLKVNGILQQYPVLLVIVCITAGISEELIFRGYILSRLSLFFKNQHWPVIISALIFTSVHLSYRSLAETIFVFLFGLLFGYYYQKYRNLAVLMAVHFITDIIAIGLFHHHK